MTQKRVEDWIDALGYTETFRIKHTKEQGRFPVSARSIKEGELVLSEPAYVITVNERRRAYVCDYCLHYCTQDISKKMDSFCTKCQEVYYCSKECEEKAMEQYHLRECDAFVELTDLIVKKGVLGNEKKRDDLICLGKLIIRVLKREGIPKDVRNTQHLKYNFTYEDIKLLHSDLKTFPEKKLKMMKEVGTAVHSILSKEKEFKQLTLQEVIHLVCKEESNAFGLYYPVNQLNNHLKKKERMFAFGLYPLQSLFNHSCSPNLYKTLKGTSYEFYALHDIPKGAELSITYLELKQGNTNQRRTELQNNYGFYCVCPRCEEDDIDDPFAKNFICSDFECGGLLVKNQKTLEKVCHICNKVQEEEDDYY